ncbi:membrane protein [Ignatzschineria indica]|uniref:Membrane protein YkvI n=1 Tax=Ignatzschineria indica TaxID=472583 RepID=A0A2U2ANR3_9GAMM|nr:hypothetical protein [Ignatzschineria indica]PWD84843.1 hypothetical protein DC082_04760 [Ignatzschineria indica]GGZ79545.1 membrane protein [Ignatzschineria indica]
MFQVLRIASAFVGIIVGAGFASGQEILQYFTSFGYMGIVGAFVATVLFAYMGMMLTRIGSIMKVHSHSEAIYSLSGKTLGVVVDAILVLTLFGVGVVMVAGAGSLGTQFLGLSPFIGSLVMTVLIVATVLMPIHRVISLIGSITPFLIVALVVICTYSLFTYSQDLDVLEPIATSIETSLPNWFVSAVNYVSFNIAVGAGMALVMGGSEPNVKIATWGGFLGGIGVGLLILLAHLAIFLKVDIVGNYPLPLLKIIQDISPVLGGFMAVVLFGMIYNTGVAMYYAFVARFTTMQTKKSYIFAIITGAVGYVASFVGFTDLIAYFYPLIGYLGLFLIAILIYAPFKLRKMAEKK